MTSFLRQYLCCCLPSARPDEDPERAPLLNPDILPEAPPRPPGRSTEEQQRKRESLQRILEHATERLINVESLAAFRPSRPESTLSAAPSTSSSPSASPARHRKKRPASSTWRPPMDDTPLAPVRVVHLGRNWEEVPTAAGSAAQPGWTRPASSHSMRTLPRGGGGGRAGLGAGAGRRHGQRGGDTDEEMEEGEAGLEEGTSADGEGEGDSQFGTVASYRTARSSGGTIRPSDVRGLWSTDGGPEVEVDEELSHAIAALETSIDDWSLPGGLGPFVAELGNDEDGDERARTS
ncbi:hypothetical protein JCM8208_005859 [Rhodotorula glutinis]